MCVGGGGGMEGEDKVVCVCGSPKMLTYISPDMHMHVRTYENRHVHISHA